jgi:hypothetical protein
MNSVPFLDGLLSYETVTVFLYEANQSTQFFKCICCFLTYHFLHFYDYSVSFVFQFFMLETELTGGSVNICPFAYRFLHYKV